MREPKRIMVGIDFSEYSREAARYAAFLSQKLGAEIDFVHVCTMPAFANTGYGSYAPLQVNEYVCRQKEIEAEHVNELKRFVAEFETPELKLSYFVLTGNPQAEILRHAVDRQIDLIVVGSHGRTGLSQILIGSVAEKILRRARCPVLTVKLSHQDFVLPG